MSVSSVPCKTLPWVAVIGSVLALWSVVLVPAVLGQNVPDQQTQQQWLAIMTRLQYVKKPNVQRILQLTEKQRESIRNMKIAVVAEPGVPIKGTQAQLDELLDARQKKVLRQLELQAVQRHGLHEVLLRRDVVKELDLSAEQQQAIGSLTRDYEKARADLKILLRQKRADGTDIHKLRQNYEQSLLAVLDSDQRARWDEMIGPPYGLILPVVPLVD